MTVEPPDRLLRLGMARAALRWAGIGSFEEYRRAQLAHLGDHAPLLRRLIARGRPDVLAALFDPPAERRAWAAVRASGRGARAELG